MLIIYSFCTMSFLDSTDCCASFFLNSSILEIRYGCRGTGDKNLNSIEIKSCVSGISFDTTSIWHSELSDEILPDSKTQTSGICILDIWKGKFFYLNGCIYNVYFIDSILDLPYTHSFKVNINLMPGYFIFFLYSTLILRVRLALWDYSEALLPWAFMVA